MRRAYYVEAKDKAFDRIVWADSSEEALIKYREEAKFLYVYMEPMNDKRDWEVTIREITNESSNETVQYAYETLINCSPLEWMNCQLMEVLIANGELSEETVKDMKDVLSKASEYTDLIATIVHETVGQEEIWFQ